MRNYRQFYTHSDLHKSYFKWSAKVYIVMSARLDVLGGRSWGRKVVGIVVLL